MEARGGGDKSHSALKSGGIMGDNVKGGEDPAYVWWVQQNCSLSICYQQLNQFNEYFKILQKC